MLLVEIILLYKKNFATAVAMKKKTVIQSNRLFSHLTTNIKLHLIS